MHEFSFMIRLRFNSKLYFVYSTIQCDTFSGENGETCSDEI